MLERISLECDTIAVPFFVDMKLDNFRKFSNILNLNCFYF